MSKYKRLCSITLAITVLLSSLVFQGFNVFANTKEGIINGTSVRLRTEANTSSAAIIKLEMNERVTVLETVSGQEAEVGHGNTWYRIRRSNGQEGYVYGFYVTVIPPQVSNENFENFPESYRESLRILKAMYPNSIFVADNLNISFDEAVNIQFLTAQRKQVASSNGLSWRSMHKDAYNWANGTYYYGNGGWVSASKSIISYYLDPRNFLGADSVFMFAQQSYNSTHTVDRLRPAVAGTFLANGYDGNPDAYIEDILEAARQSKVDPAVLAATIIVEQGSAGSSSLISGTYPGFEGFYNFFNIGASGTTEADVIRAGLQKAKEKGWNTRRAAIVGGAEFYADGYINKGQDTFYYKNFNFVNEYPSKIYHQYAQSIFDAYNNGIKLKKSYSDTSNENIVVQFKIPVFKNMPATAVAKPTEDNNQNNFYLTQINVNGLSPAFNMFTQNYSLTVSGDTTIYVKVPDGASIASQGTYQLTAGANQCVITVRAQTGYTNDYVLSVNAATPCILTVTTNDPGSEPTPPIPDNPNPEPPNPPTPPANPTLKKGDPNGDGVINGIDLAAVRLHILGLRTFADAELSAADVNGDGAVNGIDLAVVRLHILGLRIIE